MVDTAELIRDQLQAVAKRRGVELPFMPQDAGRMPAYAVINAALYLGLDPVMLFQFCESLADDLAHSYAQSA
jgi:hypothetical protein